MGRSKTKENLHLSLLTIVNSLNPLMTAPLTRIAPSTQHKRGSWSQAVSHHSSQHKSAAPGGKRGGSAVHKASPAGPKLSQEPSQVSTGKVNSFSPKAPQEHTHRPGKLRPGVVCTRPIYRHGAADIKAARSLWGIPPFSSFKREWKFIFTLYTPSLIECVRACVCV